MFLIAKKVKGNFRRSERQFPVPREFPLVKKFVESHRQATLLKKYWPIAKDYRRRRMEAGRRTEPGAAQSPFRPGIVWSTVETAPKPWQT
jgi:hypothetical protein